MKKLIAGVLCAAFLLSLFGCSKAPAAGNEKNHLWDQASPETSAMQLYVFDKGIGRVFITFNQTDERAILDRLAAVSAVSVTDWTPDKVKQPVYGIEIGSQDGTGVHASWSNGYLILRDGAVYQFDFDFSTLEKDFEWEQDNRVMESLSSMPCGRLLSEGANGWLPDRLLPVGDLTPPEGISMALKEQSAEAITVELTNNSGTEWCYGEYFSLHTLLDGVWYEVPVLDDKNYAFNDIGIILSAGSSQEKTYSLSMYGNLPKGTYRLAMYGLSAEFGDSAPNHLSGPNPSASNDGTFCAQPPHLNLATLLDLAERYGENLTWEHFDSYYHEDIGSGLYIHHYPIDENYDLLIGGGGTEVPPMYIRLVSKENPDRCIEVRTGDVAAFLQSASSSLVSIVDHSADSYDLAFDMALEPIWEDETNVYLFSCIKSSIVTVYYANGTEEDVKTALQAGRVTMADLDTFGIHYITEPKA